MDAPDVTPCTSQPSITPTPPAHGTELWPRLPAPPTHPDAALSARPAPPRDLPRTGRRCGPHGGRRPLVGRARLPGLSALRYSGARLRSRPLLRVWLRFLGRVQLQGPGRVSVLQRPPHGRDRRPSRRSGLAAAARAPMGALRSEAHPPLPAPQPCDRRRCAAHIPSGHSDYAATGDPRSRSACPNRRRLLPSPVRFIS